MKKKAQNAPPADPGPPVANSPKAGSAEVSGVYEATGPYDSEVQEPESFYPEADPSPLQVQLAEMHNLVRERNQDAKDLRLWANDATNARPLSHNILGPIKRALQKRGWLQVLSVTGEGPLSDESMEKLFHDDLEPLERTLGRLLLDAVLDGDRKFAVCVDAAIKDSDALFHRGTSEHGTMNEAFFRWRRNISDTVAAALTTAEVRKQFEKVYRVLNHREWAALRRTFHLDFQKFSQVRRGRPRKALPNKNP